MRLRACDPCDLWADPDREFNHQRARPSSANWSTSNDSPDLENGNWKNATEIGHEKGLTWHPVNRYFVTSIAAPAASGWSVRRVDLHPPESAPVRALATAHSVSVLADFELRAPETQPLSPHLRYWLTQSRWAGRSLQEVCSTWVWTGVLIARLTLSRAADIPISSALRQNKKPPLSRLRRTERSSIQPRL